ncbi:MAG: ferrous iron transport protein A [Acidobacteriota bacterium]
MKFDIDTAATVSEPQKHMTLTELPRGENARVIAVNGSGAVTRRLMEMGVIPGVGVSVVKAAPFGDPIEIRVRGYSLAMRKNEADSIEVDASPAAKAEHRN